MLELATERFVLKKLGAEDVSETYYNWFFNAENAQYISYRPTSVAELKEYVKDREIKQDCLLLGIYHDGQHIGNIKYEPIDVSKKTAEMGIFIGEPAWQGKGVAKEVIHAVNLFLKKKWGIQDVHLGVDNKNQPAISAYERLGFKIISQYPTYYIMSLELT
ncbi:GNAT family N-acetyltransferase [Pseudoalteromonas sp. SMS1]|uniref:GNAT family N-acetyltransferase n=1 Tax=Pseudoalteromonas sp. SMS1 TaxID=2908894 RepID=UPI001F41B0AE|nr:GNAT family protein [Pseudoalteromonas sp. SMS1]MCF2859364.1 GNAT family N-acetyltransferase [Pseudoalteromonas sp. SMS1]